MKQRHSSTTFPINPLYGATTNAALAGVTFDSGSYNFEILSQIDPLNSNNGAPAVFVTTLNLTSLSISSPGFSDAYAIMIFAPLVPEPSAALLGVFGLLGVLRRRR